MTKVELLEREVQKLGPAQLAKFRRWFAEFDAKMWDRQFEDDVASGKLDSLADEALDEFRRGKTRDI